jgi:acetyltransferase-like isoleucine patch superfamily enzyme
MKLLKVMHVFLIYFNLKTIYYNLHYFSFREAIHLPVFLSRNTKLNCVKGTVKITGSLKTGMIRMGIGEIGIYDKKHNPAIWENLGTVIFHGKAIIKYGAKIITGENGVLELGNNFRITSGSFIVCFKYIVFGNDCRISWDTQIIDTDFHRLYDSELNYLNPDKEIVIGNNCWIGNHCLILKGTHLKDMVVLSSNSMINKDVPECNIVLAGSPAKVVRTLITWGE